MTSRNKALKKLAAYYKQKKLNLADRPSLRQTSKSKALEHFKAKKNKKELPTIAKKKEETPYKKLSIEEYEKKYL